MELYYYRARWYDPSTGRFISEDPIGFAAGDTNLQRYVYNSPTNYIDPTGYAAKSPQSSGQIPWSGLPAFDPNAWRYLRRQPRPHRGLHRQ